jgi:flagellin-like protein
MLFDDSAVRAIQEALAPLDPLFRGVSELGGSVLLIAFVLMGFWLLDRKSAIGIAFLMLFSSLLNYGLKQVFAMSRPPEQLHKIPESGYGLPSGHAQASGAFYTSASYASGRRWIFVIAGIVISLVSLSRVYLGVHYPGDVIAGAILGIALAVPFMYLWERHAPKMTDGLIKRSSLVLVPVFALVVVIYVYLGWSSALVPGAMLGLCIGLALPGRLPGPPKGARKAGLRVAVGSLFIAPFVALCYLAPSFDVLFAITFAALSSWLMPYVIFKMEKGDGRGEGAC